MTDELDTNDRTDAPTDDEPSPADSPGSDDGSSGTQSLLKAAGATLLGATGLGLLGDTASATANRKHVIIVGYERGKHTYEITMESGGTIQKTPLAERSDATGTTQYGNEKASGELWHWNADSYAYTGEISSVQGDGSVSFHFEDGALRTEDVVYVRGEGSGQNKYSMGTPRGDIDLGYWTENPDSDDTVPLGDGERYWTQDQVSGAIRKGNWDKYDLGNGDAIQTMTISQGSVTFY